MKRPVRILIGVYLLIYVLMLLCIANDCRGQFYPVVPDCCQQAVKLQQKLTDAQSQLTKTETERDTLKAVGSRLIDAKNKRLAIYETKLKAKGDTLTSYKGSLTKSDSARTVLQEKVYQYEGRTWAGQQLRKVGKGAKVVGWTALGWSILKIFISK